MSLNFSQLRSWTAELAAIERLEKSPKTNNWRNVVATLDWIFFILAVVWNSNSSTMEEMVEVVKVISEESALTLLHAKCEKRISVNIKATVMYISEIFRIKQVEIFLIQLLPGLNIFVKKREYMGWHDNILPQQSYIFTHLQPTALNKGGKNHHQIYTVTKNSKLLDDQGVENVEELSVKEWLEHSGIDEEAVVLPAGNDSDLQADTAPKLVSYQGVVTAVLDEALGVYELDHRVRLYVSTVPAVHKYGFIHEGLKLTLHNVHCKISKELPKVQLYCCIFSMVKPDGDSSGGIKRVLFPDEKLQKLLYIQGVTIAQLDWLYTTRKLVLDNMKTVCCKRDIKNIFSVLFTSPWQEDSANYRNILDEFLSPGHACCLMTGTTSDVKALPCYRTVCQLRHDTETEGTNCTTTGDYWQFEKKEFDNNQILIGVLKTSSETGRPRLCDKSGYLDTVIAGCHGDDIAHLGCHNDRCCDTKQLGDSFSCPYLHNCCIGKIVAVNRYTVAMETFVTQGNQQLGPTTSSNDLKCHKVLYIEFSLSDAIILGDTLKKNKGIFQESNNQRCRTAANTASQKTAKFKDKDPALGRLKVEDKKKIDIENMKPSDKVNIEKDGMLSKVANANETKEKKDTVVSNDTDTETVTSMSMLHRHVSAAGGSYFCRKMNCSESRDKCVPVLSVKPIAKKRKSPECHDKTNSKILCVSKQRSPDSFKHQRSDMDAGVSSILDNSPSDTRKIVTETKSKSDEFTECYSKLRTQFDMVWSESRCIVKVNSRESAVIDTCTKDGMSVMFNVQAQIWKDGNFEPEVVIVFRGKSVRWYPILWPHAVYQFSILEEYSPLFKTGLSNSKVEQVVERSKVKKCLLVHPEVVMERVFEDLDSAEAVMRLVEIPDVIDSNTEGLTKFVSFKGQITSRTYSEPEPPKGRMQRNIGQFSSLCDWSKYQVSTPENRCIRLQVRDLGSRSEITVFMNLENTAYPLGLLPGSVVIFTRVERKVSRLKNIYARFVAVSSAHVIQISSSAKLFCMCCALLGQDISRAFIGPLVLWNQNASEMDTSLSADARNKVFLRQRLVDLWQSRTASAEFQCACGVLQILKLSLKCVCGCCGGTIVRAGCSNAGCHMENGNKFTARASFIVDDGTSVAIVTQTGSEVQRLLGLSHDQWVCLEEEIRQHGEVFVQRTYPVYGTTLEKFVYKLCDNRLVKKTWLMTLRTKQYNRSGGRSDMDFNSLSLEDFTEKSMDTGLGTVKTRCLPFLQLDCIGLQQFDPTAWALHCLSGATS